MSPMVEKALNDLEDEHDVLNGMKETPGITGRFCVVSNVFPGKIMFTTDSGETSSDGWLPGWMDNQVQKSEVSH